MTKHFLLGISILPALLVMPAMADTVAKPSWGASAVWTGLTGQELVGVAQTDDISYSYNATTGVITANISGQEALADGAGFGVFSNYFGRDNRANGDGDHVALTGFTMDNSSFADNTSYVGGAMSLWQDGREVGEDAGDDVLFPNHLVPEPPVNVISNTTFTGNSALKGGGIAILAQMAFDAKSTTTLNNVTFTGNEATGTGSDAQNGGGAIYAESTNLTINGGSFTGNTSEVDAGAILISNGNLVVNDATFKNNEATGFGGAIYNAGTMQLANATFGGVDLTDPQNPVSLGNTALKGGAILNSGSLTLSGGSFTGNTATGTGKDAADKDMGGGAIYSDLSTSVTDIDNVSFVGNSANYIGGAVYVYSGTANINNSTFTDNSANWGGAIYTKARPEDGQQISDLVINNSTFTNNSAKSVGAVGVMRKGIITNTTFTDNHATDSTDDGAGALFLGSESYTTLTGGSFVDNASAAAGGAIGTRDFGQGDNVDAKLDINGTRFEHNIAATSGGAIDNYFYNDAANDGYVNVSNATFTLNGAANGGAIYNHAVVAQTGNMSINNSSFTSNTATVAGGAIYNEGTMQLANAIFGGVDLTDPQNPVSLGNSANKGGAIYNAGTISLTGGSFVGNTAVNSGGAIENKDVNSALTLTNVNFTNNSADWAGAVEVRGTVNITGGSFTGNTSNDGGGAIYLATLENKGHKLTIDGTTFTNNGTVGTDLDGGGAIGSFSDLVLRNATFTGNYFGVENVNTTADGGGAIMMGSVSTNLIENTTFTDNISKLWGGAISMRDVNKGNNDGATLDMNNVTFTHNTAVYGGAIYNTFHNDANDDGYVSVNGATFNNNIATNNGGAIYNSAAGTTDTVGGVMQLNNSTFTGNTAGYYGGAIYNGGTLALAGTNTFTGNTANGVANDIYNAGNMTVLSGTTTLNGGITGSPSATLNIAEGATLNIGTASVAQNTINLNGTMLATLRSGDNAQITATSAFNGDGELKLAFDGEGLYHVFGGEVFTKENGIDLSSVVYDLTWSEDGKDVTASLKSVEDLAEENHLTTETAATIVNLTSSTSDVLNDLSVTIQEKLATGTEEARQEVEHAQVAINPEKESVVQSVTSSVQNAVSSLAMSRMSMPMGGRNGGDAKVTGRGVWVNGIFNKAKQNDAFNGYTRGFAAGLDGTINNKWTIGAGYSFAHSDVDGSARDTEIESSSVFVYGQYRRKAWYVNGVANYTMADYSEQGTALGMPVTADYDVKSYGANVATGYRFAGGITPELSLRYLHIDESDYVNSLGIKNELKESDYLTASLGTKYAFRIKVTKAFRLRPELSYAVKYDMLSDKQVANVTMPGLNSYALNGDRLSRIAGEFGIGLGARYKGLDVSLNYDIEAREDYTSQSGRLKFRYNF